MCIALCPRPLAFVFYIMITKNDIVFELVHGNKPQCLVMSNFGSNANFSTSHR